MGRMDEYLVCKRKGVCGDHHDNYYYIIITTCGLRTCRVYDITFYFKSHFSQLMTSLFDLYRMHMPSYPLFAGEGYLYYHCNTLGFYQQT